MSRPKTPAPQADDQTFLNNVLSCAKLNDATGVKSVVVTDFCSAARVADVLNIKGGTGKPFEESLIKLRRGDTRYIDGTVYPARETVIGFAGYFHRDSDDSLRAVFFLFIAPIDRLAIVKELTDDVRGRYNTAMQKAGDFEIPLAGIQTN